MEFTYHTALVQQLVDLNIIDVGSVELYSHETRDDPEQVVWRCNRSGLIFLEPNENNHNSTNGDDLSYWGVEQRANFLLNSEDDDNRRFHLIANYLDNAHYLDIGTGLGGILDKVNGLAKKVVAIEPQNAARQILKNLNYEVYGNIKEVVDRKFDLVTLFHVFEHLHNPLDVLRQIRNRMNTAGKLIIEVPNANDALLTLYKSQDFKRFTLWSEHLILYTQQSLQILLNSAGFLVEKIEGHQRYDLANHLYWLSHGKPGGHKIWSTNVSQEAKDSYASSLYTQGLSDTLVLTARLDSSRVT
ncbi:class I SAM-dependent methyltransferase [Paraglaciecola sp. 25GB23A]|uniref:class I SAM-dependent methyltransferase n=1 Tax=Paraglaciecola sp. 25GB23A TaxID=3156068 RepID=UPI0032AF2DC2